MSTRALLLLISACFLLIGMAVAGLYLSGGQETQARIARRRAALAQTGSRFRAAEAPAPQLLANTRRPSLAERAVQLTGYDPNIPDQYPVSLWIALGGALLAARCGVWLAAALAGPVSWIALLPLTAFLLRTYFLWCARRRRDLLLRQFPDALAMIVRGVRVGIPLAEGIRAVSRECAQPTAGIFARIGDEMAIGVTLEDALKTLTTQSQVPEYRFFATALTLQNRTGGGLTETLENLADIIRKRVAAKARGKALAAEARTSAAILAVLPLISIAGLMVLSPGYMVRLFVTPTGHALLASAVLCEGFGIFVMRTMIVRSLS